jgi:hypothetical protein
MAATITVVCPECGKAIQAPAEFAGKKVRCKACGHVFAARPAPPPGAVARSPAGGAPAAAPAANGRAPGADDDDGDDVAHYDVTTADLAPRCPECANEMENAEAIICLHCGYNTRTRERIATKKIVDTTDSDRFLWLLPGILCALAALFIVIFDLAYCLGVQSDDKSSWAVSMLAAKGLKVWLCVGSAFVVVILARFAYLRLVAHPEPPEVETR